MYQAIAANTFIFNDVDQFNEVELGWNIEYRQLSRGSLSAEMRSVVSKRIGIVHLNLGSAVHQQAVDPRGTRSLSFLHPDCPAYQWCGTCVEPGHILCSDANAGFESLSPPGFRAFALTLHDPALESIAGQMGEYESPERFRSGNAFIAPDSLARHRLHQTIDAFVDAATLSLGQESVATLEHAIYESLISMMAVVPRKDRQHTLGGRARLVARAVAYMEENARDRVNVAQVSQHLGTTSRTLERAFREHLGTSPSAVIKKLRLDGLKGEMATEGPHSSITTIAQRWGFWHMGDLGRDFLREYGVLPSELLESLRAQRQD